MVGNDKIFLEIEARLRNEVSRSAGQIRRDLASIGGTRAQIAGVGSAVAGIGAAGAGVLAAGALVKIATQLKEFTIEASSAALAASEERRELELLSDGLGEELLNAIERASGATGVSEKRLRAHSKALLESRDGTKAYQRALRGLELDQSSLASTTETLERTLASIRNASEQLNEEIGERLNKILGETIDQIGGTAAIMEVMREAFLFAEDTVSELLGLFQDGVAILDKFGVNLSNITLLLASLRNTDLSAIIKGGATPTAFATEALRGASRAASEAVFEDFVQGAREARQAAGFDPDASLLDVVANIKQGQSADNGDASNERFQKLVKENRKIIAELDLTFEEQRNQIRLNREEFDKYIATLVQGEIAHAGMARAISANRDRLDEQRLSAINGSEATEQWNRSQEVAQIKAQETEREINRLAKEHQKLFEFLDGTAFTAADAFIDFATGATTAKDAVKDFVASALIEFARLQAQTFFFQNLGALLGGINPLLGQSFLRGTGFATGGVGSFSGLPVQKMARGDVLAPGPQIAVMNEGRFDEAVLPLRRTKDGVLGVNAAGGGGGGTTNNTFQIQAVDAASFVQLASSDPEALASIVIRAAEMNPSIKAGLGLQGVLS